MLAFDAMVDGAKPGDRITVTGIYTAAPLRVNPRQRAVKSVYKTFLRILHIKRDEQSRLFRSGLAAVIGQPSAAHALSDGITNSNVLSLLLSAMCRRQQCSICSV